MRIQKYQEIDEILWKGGFRGTYLLTYLLTYETTRGRIIILQSVWILKVARLKFSPSTTDCITDGATTYWVSGWVEPDNMVAYNTSKLVTTWWFLSGVSTVKCQDWEGGFWREKESKNNIGEGRNFATAVVLEMLWNRERRGETEVWEHKSRKTEEHKST